jgi:hypothetical protein
VSNAFIPPETVPIGALHVQDGEKILGTHIFPLRLLGWPFELTNAIEITRSYITLLMTSKSLLHGWADCSSAL